MNRLLVCTAALAGIFCAACESTTARVNAPPHGVPENTNEMQGTFVYMNDNALLADMTVSDRHFLPHRPMLNSLGEQRVARLASLIEAYGGTVRLNTRVENESLIAQRMDTVRKFLADAGVDTTREVLVRDMPGGTGMTAEESLLIKKHEGTYDPERKKQQQSGGTGSILQ